MVFMPSEIHDSIIQWLRKHLIKYETSSFPSGAYMIDVWHQGKFFVIQIDNNGIGFSEIEQPDFSTIPDMRFKDLDSLLTHMEASLILKT